MYIGTSINESPVIAAQAGQAITNGALLAVAMDADGVKVVSTAGGVAVGLLIPETDNVAAGDTVTVTYVRSGKVYTTELTFGSTLEKPQDPKPQSAQSQQELPEGYGGEYSGDMDDFFSQFFGSGYDRRAA